MSEPSESLPDAQHAPATAGVAERTPGVAHESSVLNLRLILSVGGVLVVVAGIVHLAVWWLLVGYEIPHAPAPEGGSSLALEDGRRPLRQRLLDVPPPHIEGIERKSSLLTVRVGATEERRFFAALNIQVRIEDKPARLFELREGQAVTITYTMPGGVTDGLGAAISVRNPPVNIPTETAQQAPDAARMLTATVVKIEPRSVEAAREWAEAQMDRYGWADRQREIVRMPVALAMEEILQSKEFRSDERKKGEGRSVPPGRSNSGRGWEETKP